MLLAFSTVSKNKQARLSRHLVLPGAGDMIKFMECLQ